ncbi:hypothetical protein KAR91_72315 [Candidatus Pacearchaeota archaeon]|nr:hypothetical protein [Candidatus Pacearchaeota archaeon]
MKQLFVFIDTMIFLHYKAVEEINFLELFNVDKISILIPRITLRELDEQKNIHSQRKIRERAKKVLKKIEEWMKTEDPIRPNVDINYYNVIPNVDFEKHGLNQNWNDDFLLATILQYKKDNPTHDVYLISQDSGPRLTAQHLDIPSFELPQELKLFVEPDPLEVENRELKRTLTKIQSALPRLVVCFSGSEKPESHACFSLKAPSKSIDEEIEQKLAALIKKYPKRYPSNSEDTDNKNILSAFALGHLLPISAEEYERYNEEVDKYILQYERYLKGNWEQREITKRTIRFQIEIRNIGTAPADDVDIYFYFPDGFELVTEDGLLPFPKKPTPPSEPRTQAQIIAESFNRFNDFSNFSISRPYMPEIGDISAFELKKTKSYELTDHCKRIKHGDFVQLPELFLTFESFESANSFSCEYTIRPANLPQPLCGSINFVIEKEAMC